MIRGWCDQRNNLWRVPITSEGEGQSIIPPTPPADYNPSQGIIMQSLINSIYECDNTKEIIRYYHAAFFSPTKHIMLSAEKLGYFRGCPGLTRKAINNHLGIETATEKGWMTQLRQGAHTTRSPVAVPDETNDECTDIPQQEPGNSKTHKVYFTATDAGGGPFRSCDK